MRLGITIPFEPFSNRHLLQLARRAEALGYTDAWSHESYATDAFSPLAAAAAVTESMRFGTAIVPVFTRPPALIAMSAATVQEISNGRFVLGLGIATPTIVERWMGVPFRKQMSRLRESVSAIRTALSGEKTTIDGTTIKMTGFRLGAPPTKTPPIYIAAQGEKMLRLAGEIGDGLITNFITPDALPAMLRLVDDGARATGRTVQEFDVVARIVIAVDEDDAAIRAVFKRSLTEYLTVPSYNRFFSEFGFETEARVALAAWTAGDRKKAMESVPDRMIESIYVFGSAERCRRRLEDYAAGGLKTTALQFVSLAATPEERRARVIRAIEKIAQG